MGAAMNHLLAYQNSFWLADGERFMRHVHAAIAKPCPTAAQIRERHKELMQAARDLPNEAVQGTGKDCAEEKEIGKLTATDFSNKENQIRYEGWLHEAGVSAEAPRAIRAVKGKVGVIPIYGPVDQRMSGELEKAGGTPLDFVSAALDNLLRNESVGAIVLRFDSPGGSVAGVQELADKIHAARSVKPIYAIADSMAASAAYWLASAASMVIASPSADVGSVGVYTMHIDQSKAMESDGMKVTMVFAGRHKVEFSPYAPLSADAMAEAQARVDSIYDKFTGALARNMGVSIDAVRRNFGEGRVVGADKALAAGMVHRVLSYESLMAKLTGTATGGGGAKAASVADKMRMAWQKKSREMGAA